MTRIGIGMGIGRRHGASRIGIELSGLSMSTASMSMADFDVDGDPHVDGAHVDGDLDVDVDADLDAEAASSRSVGEAGRVAVSGPPEPVEGGVEGGAALGWGSSPVARGAGRLVATGRRAISKASDAFESSLDGAS